MNHSIFLNHNYRTAKRISQDEESVAEFYQASDNGHNSRKGLRVANKILAKIWTKRGLEALGEILREARKAQGWSQRDLSQFVYERTGHKISDRSIGNLENNTGEPKYNTVALLAAAGFVVNPATDKPFTEGDFIDIACEVLNPFTGQYYQVEESSLSQNRGKRSQLGNLPSLAVKDNSLVHS